MPALLCCPLRHAGKLCITRASRPAGLFKHMLRDDRVDHATARPTTGDGGWGALSVSGEPAGNVTQPAGHAVMTWSGWFRFHLGPSLLSAGFSFSAVGGGVRILTASLL